MSRKNYLFTSESVSEGHPDKVADQISDAIVDLFLSKDPEARVACETMTTTNRVVLAGEIVVSWVIVCSLLKTVELWVLGVARFLGNAGPGSGVMLMVFHVVLHCPCKCVCYHR